MSRLMKRPEAESDLVEIWVCKRLEAITPSMIYGLTTNLPMDTI
jgi:hypothetical protein